MSEELFEEEDFEGDGGVFSKYLESTAEEIGNVFMELSVMVKNGEIKALELWLMANSVGKLCKSFQETIEDEVREEVASFGQKRFDYRGYVVEIKNGARDFDFSKIKEIVQKEAELKQEKEKYKDLFERASKGQLTEEEKSNLVLPTVKYRKEPLSGAKK